MVGTDSAYLPTAAFEEEQRHCPTARSGARGHREAFARFLQVCGPTEGALSWAFKSSWWMFSGIIYIYISGKHVSVCWVAEAVDFC